MARILGVDGLARDPDLEAGALQEVGGLLGEHRGHGLADALVLHARRDLFVLGVERVELGVGLHDRDDEHLVAVAEHGADGPLYGVGGFLGTVAGDDVALWTLARLGGSIGVAVADGDGASVALEARAGGGERKHLGAASQEEGGDLVFAEDDVGSGDVLVVALQVLVLVGFKVLVTVFGLAFAVPVLVFGEAACVVERVVEHDRVHLVVVLVVLIVVVSWICRGELVVEVGGVRGVVVGLDIRLGAVGIVVGG